MTLCCLVHFVYLPVAYFRSDMFLFALDALLAIGVITTISTRAWPKFVAKHWVANLLFLFYLGWVLVSFAGSQYFFDLSSLKALRNLIFGFGVFMISSTFLTTRKRVHALLNLLLLCSLFTALYGARQLAFGFWDFELDRLALMGASLQEMQTLDRARITSTFGDPLTFGFFMMIGVFVCWARWEEKHTTVVSGVVHLLYALILVTSLVLSLTRAPLLGLACGAVIVAGLNWRLTLRNIRKAAYFTASTAVGIAAINAVVENNLLSGYDAGIIKVTNAAFESIWSLLQLFVDQVESDTYFLVGQSRDARTNAWSEGLRYLVRHPFGAGLSNSETFSFSPGDVGILKLGLQIGIIGVGTMIAILALVFAKGLQGFYKLSVMDRKKASIFLGAWVAISATAGISSMLDGAAVAVVIWAFAGVILNLEEIFVGHRAWPSSSESRDTKTHSKNKKRQDCIVVAHVTIEDICSGLFRTQVVNMARDIVQINHGVRIDIYAINRPWKLLEHRRQLRKLEEVLDGCAVRVVYLPFLPPLRHALASVAYSRMVTGLLYWAIKICIPKKYDVFHSRSYWPAMAMIRMGVRNIVFDPRSLWVLENISMGNLKENSDSHRYWLEMEKSCVTESSEITVVSTGMADYYQQAYGKRSIRLVPIAYSGKIFRYSQDGRIRFRDALGWGNAIVFVYSGSLGMSRVNVESLQHLFRLAMSCSRARLLFLTEESAEFIDVLMAEVGVEKCQYHIVHPQHEEMGDWLSACDVGLHALPRQLDRETRLGTKVVEYWACGLPVIVSDNVGAAASYIRKHGVGRVYAEDTTAESFGVYVSEVLEMERSDIAKFAADNFEARVIAQLYGDTYFAMGTVFPSK